MVFHKIQNYGIDKFYSSIAQMPIPGVCSFGMSLVNVRTTTSHFIGLSQVVKTQADIERISLDKAARKAGKERSKSGTNFIADALKKVETQDSYTHSYYQFQAYAKNTFGLVLLNIVILRTICLKNGKVVTNIWFTANPDLGYELLLHYYHLRFQIEFDFRDAKQYFGLLDFKNYKKEHVTNFVELICTMCLISKIYVSQFRKRLNTPKLSILDLKLIFNARFNGKNLIKYVRKQGISISFDHLVAEFLPADLINYQYKRQQNANFVEQIRV